jgi:transposase InsO family protein
VKEALAKHGKPEIFTRIRGAQYVSIKYTERLKEAGVEPSVGSVGDSYDNALARDNQRAFQGRGNLAARAMAQLRGGRVRHARVDRLGVGAESSQNCTLSRIE